MGGGGDVGLVGPQAAAGSAPTLDEWLAKVIRIVGDTVLPWKSKRIFADAALAMHMAQSMRGALDERATMVDYEQSMHVVQRCCPGTGGTLGGATRSLKEAGLVTEANELRALGRRRAAAAHPAAKGPLAARLQAKLMTVGLSPLESAEGTGGKAEGLECISNGVEDSETGDDWSSGDQPSDPIGNEGCAGDDVVQVAGHLASTKRADPVHVMAGSSETKGLAKPSQPKKQWIYKEGLKVWVKDSLEGDGGKGNEGLLPEAEAPEVEGEPLSMAGGDKDRPGRIGRGGLRGDCWADMAADDGTKDIEAPTEGDSANLGGTLDDDKEEYEEHEVGKDGVSGTDAPGDPASEPCGGTPVGASIFCPCGYSEPISHHGRCYGCRWRRQDGGWWSPPPAHPGHRRGRQGQRR